MMLTDELRLDDDPAALAAAVRDLAADAHVVLTREVSAEPVRRQETLSALLRRIDGFRRGLGESRPDESRLRPVRQWLDGLRRQALVVLGQGPHHWRMLRPARQDAGAMDRAEAVGLLRAGAEGVQEWNRRREAGAAIPDLLGVDLHAADLRGADLRKVDLRRADLSGANLRGAMLDGATFVGAKIGGIKF